MASHDQGSVASAPLRQRSKMWQSVRYRIRSPSIKSSSTLGSNTANHSVASYKDYQLHKPVSLKSVSASQSIRKVKNEKPTRKDVNEASTSTGRSLKTLSEAKMVHRHPNDSFHSKVSHPHQQGISTLVSPLVNPERAGGLTRSRSNSCGSFYDRYEQEMTFRHDDQRLEDDMREFHSPSREDQTEESSQSGESLDFLEKLSCVATTQLISDYFSTGKSLYNKTFTCTDSQIDVMDLRYSAGGWLKKAVLSKDVAKQNEDNPLGFSQESDDDFENINPIDDNSLYTDDSEEKFSVEQSTIMSSIVASRDDDHPPWQDLAEGLLSIGKPDRF
jgi:hypothetical protein